MTRQGEVFRVMLRMEIRAGMEKEFEKTWYKVGGAITEHPANIRQWLARSADDECVYYVVSDWTDEPGFREFERSERHLEHRTRLHPYRSHGSMTTMRIVYEMAGANGGEGA